MEMKMLFFLYLVIFSLISISEETQSKNLKSNSITTSNLKFLSNQSIVLTGFEGSFIEVNIQTTPPNLIKEVRQKKLPFAQLYSISLLDQEHQVLYQIPIGDPFNLYAEHFGYEGEQTILPIKNPYLEVPIPVTINPVYIRLDTSYKGEIRLGEEIQVYRR